MNKAKAIGREILELINSNNASMYGIVMSGEIMVEIKAEDGRKACLHQKYTHTDPEPSERLYDDGCNIRDE